MMDDENKTPENDEKEPGKALKMFQWIIENGINGIGPLCSSENLAEEYRNNPKYKNDEERIDALIRWETTKNFTTGFVTGLGGILTMPVTMPAAFGATWIIQARLVAAIASLAGHDVKSDQVRTFVMVCLTGDAVKDVMKPAGITIGRKLTEAAFKRVPGKALIEINKKVGFRLLTKAGEKGAVNLMKVVPVAGGIVGGVFDSATCRVAGKNAKKLFLIE